MPKTEKRHAKKVMDQINAALEKGETKILTAKEVEKALERIRKTREDLWKERLASRH
ncbi:MAG: hypothetical protein HY401_00450 [Elusimicrobia bacterium]|nr:hypothetical protein [Elusimicrobiota bacterium]